MKTIKRTTTLEKYLGIERKKKLNIGFIPTMGALHEGHLSLIKACRANNDIVIVSIFVNPKQFNQKEDLVKYPRDLAKDKTLIKDYCDYLFAPSVNQIYPNGKNTKVKLNIDHLIQSMEGPNRPGHFEGVVQVIHRFLKIIKPDSIYMGQKDFQQFSIIAYLINQKSLPVKLHVCPTKRERDGLAMSSRNLRLAPKHRKKSNIIYQALNFAKEHLKQLSVKEIEQKAIEMLSLKEFKPEYFDIVDAYSFKTVSNIKKHKVIVACTAVWVGNVRLIDNMILKGEDKF